MLSLANAFPEECVRLFLAQREGRAEDADRLNTRLVELNTQVSGTYGVAGVKAAMDMAGYAGGEPRRPHLGLKPEEVAQLRVVLQTNGFLR